MLSSYQDWGSFRTLRLSAAKRTGRDTVAALTGFPIQLNTPKGIGTVSENEREQLLNYAANEFMALISKDYDMVIIEVDDYMHECDVVRADVCSRQGSPWEGTYDGSIE